MKLRSLINGRAQNNLCKKYHCTSSISSPMMSDATSVWRSPDSHRGMQCWYRSSLRLAPSGALGGEPERTHTLWDTILQHCRSIQRKYHETMTKAWVIVSRNVLYITHGYLWIWIWPWLQCPSPSMHCLWQQWSARGKTPRDYSRVG